MSPEIRARLLRIMALRVEHEAGRLRLAAAAVEAAEALRKFGEALQATYDDELAQHPDMAEFNVQMDALYERPYP